MKNETNEYLLLFRDCKPGSDASPNEMQAFMDQWMAWYEDLSESGKFNSGHPLEESVKLVTKGSVSDGPFAETKEMIGGFFHIKAASLEEATKIAQQCPGLDQRGSVEVRTIADCCSAADYAEEEVEKKADLANA